jgi:hypothetical protein
MAPQSQSRFAQGGVKGESVFSYSTQELGTCVAELGEEAVVHQPVGDAVGVFFAGDQDVGDGAFHGCRDGCAGFVVEGVEVAADLGRGHCHVFDPSGFVRHKFQVFFLPLLALCFEFLHVALCANYSISR